MDLFTSFPEPDEDPRERSRRKPSGPGGNWFILIGVTGFLAACAYITVSWLKANASPEYQNVKKGLAEWRVHEMELEAQRAEARVIEGRDAMTRDEAKEVYQAIVDAREMSERYLDRWPDHEFRPGITVQAWWDSLEARYLGDVANYFDKVIERVKRSEFDVQTAETLTRDLAFYGFDDPKEQWASRHEEIAQARADAAAKWVRVTFSGNSDLFNQAIQAEIEKRWQQRYGFRLVYGPPLDSREESATWKHVAVRTHLTHAENRILDSVEQARNATMPRVPQRVQITLALVGTPEIPTSWDKLPPYLAEVPVPAYVRLDPLLNQGSRDAESVIADRQAALTERVHNALKTLPTFELFPGVPPDTPLVDENDRLRLPAAQALIYGQPETALKRFSELAASGNGFLREDICRAAILAGADYLGGLIARLLPDLDTLKQRRITGLLAHNPAFGDYQPILSLLLRPKEGIFPEEAVNALRPHLHTPKIRDLFMKLINDQTVFRRYSYAIALLQESGLPEVEILAPAWVANEDARFASRIFTAVSVKHPSLARRLAMTVFDDVSDSVQHAMLNFLRLGLGSADDEVMQLFKRNALRQDSSLIVDLAYESLVGVARTHRGWKVLRELDEVESNPNRRQLIKRALMSHVEYLHPESARKFLFEQLAGDPPDARHHAIGLLLDRSDSTPETLSAVAGILRREPDDKGTIRAAILGLHQNIARSAAWDLENNPQHLLDLMSGAVRHNDAQIRQFSYNIMSVAAESGSPQFHDLLRAAQRREETPILREHIAALLRKLAAE